MHTRHLPPHSRCVRWGALLTLLLAVACGDDGGTTPDPGDRVAAVVVSPDQLILTAGETRTLEASAKAGDGRVLPGKPISWSSASHSVAVVSAAGEVTGVAPGTTTIRASSEGRSGSLALTVLPAEEPVARVEITPTGSPQSLLVGATRQLSATARAENGSELTGRPVNWTSSHEAVVRVSGTGLLEAREIGSATVTASIEGRSAQVQIVVSSPVASVSVDPAVAAVAVGEVMQITAQPRSADNVALNRPVKWTSSDSTVATVNQSGRVTGHRRGTAVITATSDGKSGVAYLIVDAWTELPLLAAGDATLPTTLFTYPERDAAGEIRTVRFQVTEGYLRMLGAGSRYQLMVHGWLHREGSPAIQMGYASNGEYHFDAWEGAYVFSSGSESTFRGRLLPDGRLGVTWRAEPKAPSATLIFRAP